MSRTIRFLEEFYDTILKLANIIMYASFGMIFVAGFLMAYARVPMFLALSTILLPAILAVIIATVISYRKTYGGY